MQRVLIYVETNPRGHKQHKSILQLREAPNRTVKVCFALQAHQTPRLPPVELMNRPQGLQKETAQVNFVVVMFSSRHWLCFFLSKQKKTSPPIPLPCLPDDHLRHALAVPLLIGWSIVEGNDPHRQKESPATQRSNTTKKCPRLTIMCEHPDIAQRGLPVVAPHQQEPPATNVSERVVRPGGGADVSSERRPRPLHGLAVQHDDVIVVHVVLGQPPGLPVAPENDHLGKWEKA